MAQDNAVCNDVALIAAVKAADTFSTGKIMIASQSATIPTQADLDIHFGTKEAGNPISRQKGLMQIPLIGRPIARTPVSRTIISA